MYMMIFCIYFNYTQAIWNLSINTTTTTTNNNNNNTTRQACFYHTAVLKRVRFISKDSEGFHSMCEITYSRCSFCKCRKISAIGIIYVLKI